MAALAELGALSGSSALLEEFLPRALEVVIASVGCRAAGVFAAAPDAAAARADPQPRPRRAPAPPSSPGRLHLPLGAVLGSRRLVVAHLEDLDPDQRAWAEGTARHLRLRAAGGPHPDAGGDGGGLARAARRRRLPARAAAGHGRPPRRRHGVARPAPGSPPPRRRARGHPRAGAADPLGRARRDGSAAAGGDRRGGQRALGEAGGHHAAGRGRDVAGAGRRPRTAGAGRRPAPPAGAPLAGGRGAALRRPRLGREHRARSAQRHVRARGRSGGVHAGGAAGRPDHPTRRHAGRRRARPPLLRGRPGAGLGAGGRAGAGAGERRALRQPPPGAGEEHPEVPPGGARRALGGDRPRGPQPARRHLQLARLAAPPHRDRGRHPHAARHRRRGGRPAQPDRRRPARLRAPLPAAAGARPAGAGGRRGGQRGGGPAATRARGGPEARRHPARGVARRRPGAPGRAQPGGQRRAGHAGRRAAHGADLPGRTPPPSSRWRTPGRGSPR